MPPNTLQPYELGGYVFDRRTMRYHGPAPSYAMVSNERIMGLVQERIGYHQGQMLTLTQALADGRLTLAQWQTAFALQLKDLHLQQAALAHGGWQNMTNTDFLQVARTSREQYSYLQQFGLDIALGYPPERLLWRAGLYAASGRQSYWLSATATAEAGNMRQERRIARGDDRTCGPCVDLERKGWQPIGTLPPPGGPPCAGIVACRCEKEYR